MKKLMIVAVMAVMGLAASAQSGWVGGGFSLGVQSTKPDGLESTTTTSIGIAPEIGFNVTDRIAVAAELALDYMSVEGSKITTFGVGPYARYTFTNNSRVNVFGEFAVHYLSTKNEGMDAMGGFNLQLRPGISVALNENWSLVGKYSILEYAQISNDGYKIGTTSLQIGTNFSVGFMYKF